MTMTTNTNTTDEHPPGMSQKGNYPAPPKYALPSPRPRRRIHTQARRFYSRYLNDFSKALANEVRILLAEVGKLRDERRALQ